MARKTSTQADFVPLAQELRDALAHACRMDGCCSLVLLRTTETGDARNAPDVQIIARWLRPIIRHTDEIVFHGENVVGVLLHGGRQRNAQTVARRIVEAFEGPARHSRRLAHLRLVGETRRHIELCVCTLNARDVAALDRLDDLLRRAWQQSTTITVNAPLWRQRTTIPLAPASQFATPLPQWSQMAQGAQGAQGSQPPQVERRTTTYPPASEAEVRVGARLRLIRGGRAEPTTPLGHTGYNNYNSYNGHNGYNSYNGLARNTGHGGHNHNEETMRQRAQMLGVPFLRLPRSLPSFAWQGISTALAHELRAVPVGRSQRVLTVAMDNPNDIRAVFRLRAATGLAIFPVLARTDELDRALNELSSKS